MPMRVRATAGMLAASSRISASDTCSCPAPPGGWSASTSFRPAIRRASSSSEKRCTSTPSAALILSSTGTVSGRWFCSIWFR
jgi:hypothetical protein